MPLRPLLAHIEEDPAALSLARDGGNAFVSSSLRPYVIASLAELDGARERAQLIVVGDDRAARGAACATPRRAASRTSRTCRRRRTSSGCAWRRSTRCSAPSATMRPSTAL